MHFRIAIATAVGLAGLSHSDTASAQGRGIGRMVSQAARNGIRGTDLAALVRRFQAQQGIGPLNRRFPPGQRRRGLDFDDLDRDRGLGRGRRGGNGRGFGRGPQRGKGRGMNKGGPPQRRGRGFQGQGPPGGKGRGSAGRGRGMQGGRGKGRGNQGGGFRGRRGRGNSGRPGRRR